MEDSSCSSSSSASSIQTRVQVLDKAPAASDTGTDSIAGEPAESPRHLLELRVSLSSPNLLHSSVAFTVSSSSSEADVSYSYEVFYIAMLKQCYKTIKCVSDTASVKATQSKLKLDFFRQKQQSPCFQVHITKQ